MGDFYFGSMVFALKAIKCVSYSLALLARSYSLISRRRCHRRPTNWFSMKSSTGHWKSPLGQDGDQLCLPQNGQRTLPTAETLAVRISLVLMKGQQLPIRSVF